MTANSDVTAFIEKAIEKENNDFYKVLHQVAAGFQNKGFFLQSNCYEILKASFNNIDESEDEIIETTFHTSNSNGTTSSRLLSRKNIVVDKENITADMFDEPFTQAKPIAKQRRMSMDSNDSFEIPETQADPPVNCCCTAVEDDGDDFIAIPVEDIATNTECILQSQNLLGGVALFNSQINVSAPTVEEKHKTEAAKDDDFDSNDAIELEMSKLEYADTTKDEDDLRSASVTPDLDFDLLSSTKTCEIEVAPNLDLVQSKNEQTNDSKKITNDTDENLDETPDDLVAVTSHNPEIQPSDPTIVEKSSDNEPELNIPPDGHVELNLQDVEKQLFKKPDRPVAENLNDVEVQVFAKPHRPVAESSIDIPTQLFVKPHRLVLDNVNDAQTQLFVKPNRPVANNLQDAETQLFEKPNQPVAATSSDDEPQLFEEPDLSDEENVCDVATQAFKKPERPVANHSHDEDDDIYGMSTQKMEISKPESRKRKADDDEPIPPKINKSPLASASSTKVKVKDIATENYITIGIQTVADQLKLGEIFKNKKYQFLEAIRRSSWTKICSEANHKQLKVQFNVFDQCKEIQVPNECTTTTEIVEPIPNVRESVTTIDVAAMEPVTRKSSRAKKLPRKYLEDVIAVTEMNIATGTNSNKDTSRNIKSPVSSPKLANIKKREPSKTSGNQSGALLAVVNETKEKNTASSRKDKSKKNTRSNQNQSDQTSTSRVSKQHKKPETTPVSSKSLADVESIEANKKNGDDVATQLFVKTSQEHKKVSTRASKTVNTTTKSNQNQDDDDQVSPRNARSNQNQGNHTSTSRVSKQHKKPETSPVSSKSLADVESTDANKKNGDDVATQLFVKTSQEHKKVSTRASKTVNTTTKSNQNQDDDDQVSSRNARSNQNQGDQTSTRTVSKQHKKPETSPVSSKSLADVESTEANKKNGDDVATQLFVKTSQEHKKVSTRASKTVNTTTKSNQDDDNQTSTDAVANRSRKRKASTTLPAIPSKVSASLSSLQSPILSSSPMNRSSRHQPLRVMFTMINPEPHKPILKRLNISMVDTDDTYDALVTDRVYRSSKFMCALASGKPIVSTEWLKALQEQKTSVDPSMFLLKDKDGEKKYRFSLAKTIAKSAKQGFFHRHSILVTPNTSPSPEILKDVIVSSGGKYLKGSLHPRKDDQILCVSDRKDENVWPQLKKKYQNLKIVNVEGFMQAIFQYNLNVEEYGLK